jgi:hypothetical protein
MRLAAHLEGVMNRTFLVALGAVWNEMRLGPRTKTIAFWVALLGTYGNWLMTTLALSSAPRRGRRLRRRDIADCRGRRAW